MKARLAFLTSPAPGHYTLNFQAQGSDELIRIDIDHCHLTNIVVDGVSLALREFNHRVPVITSTESANGQSGPQLERSA